MASLRLDPDPAGLSDIRARLQGEAGRRWANARREVRRAVMGQDALGLGSSVPRLAQPVAVKAQAFRQWLDERLSRDVVGTGSWLDASLDEASSRAVGRSRSLWAGRGLPTGDAQQGFGFLAMGFAPPTQPHCKDAARGALAGVCDAVSDQAQAAVASGLLSPKARPMQIARLLDGAFAGGLKRTRTLIEHAVTMAHAQSTLDALEAMGETHVGTEVDRRRADDADAYVETLFEEPETGDDPDEIEAARRRRSLEDPDATAASVRAERRRAAINASDQGDKPCAAGIMFMTPDGRALFLRRTDGEGWAFPGGGYEEPETAENGAQREAQEELGGFWARGGLTEVSRNDRGPVDYTTFAAQADEPFAPTLNEEHDDWGWFPVDEPPAPLHPGVAWTLRRLASDAGMLDFDPDEPRDPQGKWTTGAGYEFVSPSTDLDLKLPTAITRLKSDQERQLIEAAADVNKEIGVAGTKQSAVLGAWEDGAEHAVMTEAETDWEHLKLAAAIQGHLTAQKAVLVFQETPEPGEEHQAVLYSFPATGHMAVIHQLLLRDGVMNHTLRPTPGGATVYVADLEHSADLRDAVKRAAARYDSKIDVREGRAEFIGTDKHDGTDEEQRQDARRIYERAIERSGVPGASAAWGRLRDRWASAFTWQGEYGRLLEQARALEGLEAAVRDPSTGKVYTGSDHNKAFFKLPEASRAKIKEESVSKDPEHPRRFYFEGPHVGFVGADGKFISREELEKSYALKTDYRYGVSGPSMENVSYTRRALKSELAQFHQDSLKWWTSEERDPEGRWTTGAAMDDPSAEDVFAMSAEHGGSDVRFVVREDGSVAAGNAMDHTHLMLKGDRPMRYWGTVSPVGAAQGSLAYDMSKIGAAGRPSSVPAIEARKTPFVRRLEAAGIRPSFSVRHARDAVNAGDAFLDLLDAARKNAQARHPRTGQYAKAHVVARELHRHKKTGRFQKQGPAAREQAQAERAEAHFAKLKGRWDVLTKQDDKVCKRCQEISDNGPYTIARARSLIPAHPNCRCVFVPYGQMGARDAGPCGCASCMDDAEFEAALDAGLLDA